MKAAIYTRYGPSDVVQITEIAKPVPKEKEVLIRVRAASVNPLDGALMGGRPLSFRLFTGLVKPSIPSLGVDVAGEVEAVGKSVAEFKPGDAVFALSVRHPEVSGVGAWTSRGAFAEYTSTSASNAVLKPNNISFEHAASVPVAALTALQGIRDKGQIQPGQKVLINGASGGVGTFAVQIAKFFGAEVTAVCSARNVAMVKSIGADHVIDYTREDSTRIGLTYDLFFDCIGNHSLSACLRILKPGGTYVAAGGPGSRWMIGLMSRPLAMLALSRVVKQKLVLFLATPNKRDLVYLRDLISAGKLTQ